MVQVFTGFITYTYIIGSDEEMTEHCLYELNDHTPVPCVTLIYASRGVQYKAYINNSTTCKKMKAVMCSMGAIHNRAAL